MNLRISSFFLAVLLCASFVLAQTKVVCIGDSITQGWNGHPSFVPLLQKLLGSQYTVVNAGRSGATMLKAGDVPFWTQAQFSTAVKSQANIFLIMLGTNDSKSKNWGTHSGEFKGDYQAMIDTLRKTNPNAKILLVFPPPAFSSSYGISNDVINAQIPQVKDIAAKRSLAVVDVNKALLPFSRYFDDGVHPDTAGADTIAHVYLRAIMTATTGIDVPPGGTTDASSHHVVVRETNLLIDGISPRTGLVSIRAVGLDGREVWSRRLQVQAGASYDISIDAKAWPTGMYVISRQDAAGIQSVTVPVGLR